MHGFGIHYLQLTGLWVFYANEDDQVVQVRENAANSFWSLIELFLKRNAESANRKK